MHSAATSARTRSSSAQHQEIAFRVAYLITRNAADAEDAAQDGLRQGLARARPLPRRRAAAAVAAAHRRQRGAQPPPLRGPPRAPRDPPAESPGEAAPSPEEAAVGADERRRLLAALDELPEQARLVLACRYLLGLSEDETASALGVRRGTVKSRSARALERLREGYGPRA